MLACGMTTDEEDNRQDSKKGKERQFDIRAKDGQPFAETQRHNRAPRRPPDEGKGDDDFDRGVTSGVSEKFVVGVLKPERLYCCDGCHRERTTNPEWIGDPVQHGAEGGKYAPSCQFAPLVDATLLGKRASQFGGQQAVRD